jgi:pimeloyl-ACP methyl ester carboxylesterase
MSSVIEGRFDVGGHSLFLRCRGTGSPTVIYLHGIAQDAYDQGLEHADPIAPFLDEQVRFCQYDRANVGQSDQVEGKQTAIDAVHDLYALIAKAGIPGPYVILGASFGGLVGYEFVVTHPRDIVGMVVLDPTLPREYLDIDPYYHPDDGLLTGQEWKDNAEHMDWLGSMQETQVLEGDEPRIPLTYIALKDPATWWHPVTAASIAAYRKMQQRFVDLWSPGRMEIIDTPHFMEPVIPERIADEVRSIIELGRGGA